jgi:hypothetical protein
VRPHSDAEPATEDASRLRPVLGLRLRAYIQEPKGGHQRPTCPCADQRRSRMLPIPSKSMRPALEPEPARVILIAPLTDGLPVEA